MIERQRRQHALILDFDAGAGPGEALQRIGDQIAVRQHRAFRHAGRAAGILQQARHRRHAVRHRDNARSARRSQASCSIVNVSKCQAGTACWI